MKKIIILSISIIFSAFYLLAQPEKEIKAEMKQVTVFPDRAQINHESSVSLPTGKTVLKLSSLSPYIDPQSVQVKGFGDFTILSVTHQNNYLQNLEESSEIKNLRSQLEALLIKVEDEKAAIAVLKEKEAFLVANRAILVKETTFSVEQLKSVMELYTSNMEQVTMTILKKGRLIKDYEKQIAALQQQISDRLGKQNLPSGEIYVTANADKQVSGRLYFSFVVMNAGWYPSYDIRVDDIKNPVSIFYKANVYQNSGVPWKDVKLSFSNATPWISGDVPVLYPWFIDYYVPIPMLRKGRAAGVNRDEAPAMMEVAASDLKMEAKEMEAAPIPVQKQTGETTITFDISIPYSIPSDGKIQTVEIQRLTAPADYKYVTLPKVAQHAYLTANITDWAKLSLQAGEATLYFENAYVGKSNLDVNQLTDTLTLSLGTDNSILVKREKRQDFTSKRVIGSNKTENFSFLLTIRNNKSTGIRITLQDQIPVSSNSGITVEAVELSGGRHNIQTGEIKWDIEMMPQETKQIVLTYSVKYPKDKTVILE
ncbi:MAG: hypothetical protein A2X04_01860 [Bacteroidetes bacterium GWF2_41_9]|nr:MAG: hypothetical protein A2X04_01860 [Bacteroidetes bacterium GWF2_41_9]